MSRPVLALSLFLALTLAPIWTLDFVPLQDYPQHLFIAMGLRDAWLEGRTDTPVEVHLNPLYVSFSLPAAFLGRFMPMDTAGRAVLSLYPIVIGWGVWQLLFLLRRSEDGPGWGAFLLFPALYNPFYYLGTINYLFGMAVLMLVLIDLARSLDQGWTRPGIARQAGWVVLLTLAHPFGLVDYLAVVSVWTVLFWREPRVRQSLLLALVTAGVAFVALYLVSKPSGYGQTSVKFLGLVNNLRFLVGPFTNGAWEENVDLVMIALWALALGLGAWAAWRHGWASRRLAGMAAVVLAGALFSGLLMPWGFGGMNFALGFRLGALLYFFLGWLMAAVRLRGASAAIYLTLAAAIVSQSYLRQAELSREIASFRPILAVMEPGQKALTLLFDQGLSPWLDWMYFQPHNHDTFYYPLTKGGISPSLWQLSYNPVRYKAGVLPPAPDLMTPFSFRWEEHGGYRYYLVRGGTPQTRAYMLSGAREVTSNGPWTLYERP